MGGHDGSPRQQGLRNGHPEVFRFAGDEQGCQGGKRLKFGTSCQKPGKTYVLQVQGAGEITQVGDVFGRTVPHKHQFSVLRGLSGNAPCTDQAVNILNGVEAAQEADSETVIGAVQLL